MNYVIGILFIGIIIAMGYIDLKQEIEENPKIWDHMKHEIRRSALIITGLIIYVSVK